MKQDSETRKPNKLQGRLLFDSVVMFGANALGSLIGFSYHLAMARIGGPTVYADFGALMSMNFIMSVVAVTIQTYVAARIARPVADGENVRPYLGRTISRVALSGIPIGFTFALLAPWAARFFDLKQTAGVIVVGCAVIPLLILSVVRGGLQGTQKFVGLGSLRMVEPSVQLGAGILLVMAGLGAPGAVAGAATGLTVSMMIGLFILKPTFRGMDTISAAEPDKGIGFITQIVLFLSFVTWFMNVDILLVKHHFVHEEAAQYVAASFMSRILYLSAASIGFALFPKTAANRPGQSGPLLKKSLLYYLAFAVPFIGFCSIFPKWVVGLFYGEAYGPAAQLLPRMLLAYGIFCVAYLIGNYRISRNRRRVWIAFFVASTIQAFCIGLWPTSLLRISSYMILSAIVMIVLSMVPMGNLKLKADKS